MPRKNLIRVGRMPYHVVSRTHNQHFFKKPLAEVWLLLLEALEEANQMHPIKLISLVLMGNHYHMLLFTPNKDLDEFMREFNRRFALKLKCENENQIFGGRYKWSIIKSQKYLFNCYKYIYQNPLRAEIVNRVEYYPYSTLHYIKNNFKFVIPIYDHFGFKDQFNLEQLNTRLNEDELFQVKKDLKRYLVPFK